MNASQRLLIIWIAAGFVALAAIFMLGMSLWPYINNQFINSKTLTPSPTETATHFILPPTWTETVEAATPSPRPTSVQFPSATRARLIMPTLFGTPILVLPSSTITVFPTRLKTPTHIPMIIHSSTPTLTPPGLKPTDTKNP